MNWGGPDFIIAIVAVCTVGWLVNNWIRARHGYALEDEWGGKTERPDNAATADLKRENAALKARLDALESRAAAIETIVTDQGYDVARQIEGLRATRKEVIAQ
jgi:hypothetical protein